MDLIQNWLLAEIAGAVYSAAALGDKERMERFLYGPGGAADELAKGVLDDGWWYEASIGYNLMCHKYNRSSDPFLHLKFQTYSLSAHRQSFRFMIMKHKLLFGTKQKRMVVFM